MTRRFKGNSLLEYILPLGLFFLSGIIIIVVGDVPGRISAFFTDTVDATMVGTTAEIKTIGELSAEKYALQQKIMAGTVSRIGGERTPLYDRTDEVCFSSGMCLDIPVISNSAGVADTAGGLGGDLAIKLASTFEQIATQLEDAGMDPTIVSYVTMLSNGGHDIGTSMQVIAEACEVTPCSPSVISSEISSFNSGKSSFQNRLNLLNTYLDQNPSALDAFPKARDIITLEAEQIMAIANGANYDANYSTSYSTSTSTSTVQTTPTGGTSGGATASNVSCRFITVMRGIIPVPQMVCTGSVSRSTRSSSQTLASYDIETGDYSELVHQSANDICQQGGDTGECVIRRGAATTPRYSRP